jgi:tRNA threonylcarbamoyladenosine biosynthesis protein TsaE
VNDEMKKPSNEMSSDSTASRPTNKSLQALPWTKKTTSAQQTREFGSEIAGFLSPGDLVLVEGELGAGKTTFVQGLASGLGVEEPVASPTFTLVRIYETGRRGHIERLLHADLYRLERLQEVIDLGLLELVDDAAVAAVEWGEAGVPVFGPEFLEIRIDRPRAEHGEESGERLITISGTGSWSGRAADVVSAITGPARAGA